MKIYEVIDDKDRIMNIKYTNENPTEVVKSHTFSYLYTRNQYKEIGIEMSLEKDLKKELKNEKEN